MASGQCLLDYRDQLWLDPTACQALGFAEASAEPKQCLLLHVAAAYLSRPGSPLPAEAAVQAQALSWRLWWAAQARVAEDSLGPVPARLSQAEADVRVFHHDLLYFGHDRDYRTLVAHPLDKLADLGLAVLRLDAYLRPTVEVLRGARYQGDAASTRWVLIHKGHMRLLRPDSPQAPPLGSRELDAIGWEAYLEAAGDAPLLDTATLLQCQVCHPADSQAPSARVVRPELSVCKKCALFPRKPVPWLAPSPARRPTLPRQTGLLELVCPPLAPRCPCCFWANPRCAPLAPWSPLFGTTLTCKKLWRIWARPVLICFGCFPTVCSRARLISSGDRHYSLRPRTSKQAGVVLLRPRFIAAPGQTSPRARNLPGPFGTRLASRGPFWSGPGLSMLRFSFAVPSGLLPALDALVAWRLSADGGGPGRAQKSMWRRPPKHSGKSSS